MARITFAELERNMFEYNGQHPDKQETPSISGVIVFKASNWDADYNETERSYRVTNANRAFQEGKISNSLRGNCLDGKDDGVRLDWYNWDIDYCYME